MESKYIEDLEAWVKAKAIKKPDANVAAFLAVRDLVKARLDDGYSATIIHDFLRAGQHIDICYDTFLKYVHRYVQRHAKGQRQKAEPPERLPMFWLRTLQARANATRPPAFRDSLSTRIRNGRT